MNYSGAVMGFSGAHETLSDALAKATGSSVLGPSVLRLQPVPRECLLDPLSALRV
ncbi:MAG: hypothetical protein NTV34_09655 [Proteobacteria bacterium]|nr:hypothetical protein [Pseudomonadota bacterium]